VSFISRLCHAAYTLAVYASWSRSPVVLHGHARLASGWWSSLSGRDSNPLGCFVRFPVRTYIASSSPRLILAHDPIQTDHSQTLHGEPR
jgi:hypothetical protein